MAYFYADLLSKENAWSKVKYTVDRCTEELLDLYVKQGVTSFELVNDGIKMGKTSSLCIHFHLKVWGWWDFGIFVNISLVSYAHQGFIIYI